MISIYLVICSLSSTIFETIKQYALHFQVRKPFILIQLLTTLLYFVMSYNLIEKYILKGILISQLLTQLFDLIILFGYILLTRIDQLQIPLIPHLIKQKQILNKFILMAIPSLIYNFLIMLTFTFMDFGSTKFGLVACACQFVFQNLSDFFYRIPNAYGLTLSLYLMVKLKDNQIEQAKNYCRIAVTQYFALLVMLIILSIILRNQIAEFYFGNDEISHYFLDIQIFFLLISVLFDGIQGIFACVLKELDQNKINSNVTLIVYLVFGVPLMVILSVVANLQVKGIWIGFGITNMLLVVYQIYKIVKINWNYQAQRVQQSDKEEELPPNSNDQN